MKIKASDGGLSKKPFDVSAKDCLPYNFHEIKNIIIGLHGLTRIFYLSQAASLFCFAPTELSPVLFYLVTKVSSLRDFFVIGLKGYLPQSGKIIRYIRVNPMIKKILDENKSIRWWIVKKTF